MPRKKSSARRPSPKTKIFLALLTTLNLGLSLALSLQRRRQVLQAVSTDKDVQLLFNRALQNPPSKVK